MRTITSQERGQVEHLYADFRYGLRVQEAAVSRLARLLGVDTDTALDACNGAESFEDFTDRIGVETIIDDCEPYQAAQSPGAEFFAAGPDAVVEWAFWLLLVAFVATCAFCLWVIF